MQALYTDEAIKPHKWLRWMFPTFRSYENVHILLWLGESPASSRFQAMPDATLRLRRLKLCIRVTSVATR
jgi:hypothetical protein